MENMDIEQPVSGKRHADERLEALRKDMEGAELNYFSALRESVEAEARKALETRRGRWIRVADNNGRGYADYIRVEDVQPSVYRNSTSLRVTGTEVTLDFDTSEKVWSIEVSENNHVSLDPDNWDSLPVVDDFDSLVMDAYRTLSDKAGLGAEVNYVPVTGKQA